MMFKMGPIFVRCRSKAMETNLYPIENDARCDIKANVQSVLDSLVILFSFSISVFFVNPLAKTSRSLTNRYKYHENIDCLKFRRFLDVEHSSFRTLIFFSCKAIGGQSQAMNRFPVER